MFDSWNCVSVYGTLYCLSGLSSPATRKMQHILIRVLATVIWYEMVILATFCWVEWHYVNSYMFAECFPHLFKVRSMNDLDGYVRVMVRVIITLMEQRLIGLWTTLRSSEFWRHIVLTSLVAMAYIWLV